MKALISVYDKTGIVEFGKQLVAVLFQSIAVDTATSHGPESPVSRGVPQIPLLVGCGDENNTPGRFNNMATICWPVSVNSAGYEALDGLHF